MFVCVCVFVLAASKSLYMYNNHNIQVMHNILFEYYTLCKMHRIHNRHIAPNTICAIQAQHTTPTIANYARVCIVLSLRLLVSLKAHTHSHTGCSAIIYYLFEMHSMFCAFSFPRFFSTSIMHQYQSFAYTEHTKTTREKHSNTYNLHVFCIARTRYVQNFRYQCMSIMVGATKSAHERATITAAHALAHDI